MVSCHCLHSLVIIINIIIIVIIRSVGRLAFLFLPPSAPPHDDLWWLCQFQSPAWIVPPRWYYNSRSGHWMSQSGTNRRNREIITIINNRYYDAQCDPPETFGQCFKASKEGLTCGQIQQYIIIQRWWYGAQWPRNDCPYIWSLGGA